MSQIVVRRWDWAPAIRPLPADCAVSAIGDVHGHDGLFAALSEALAEEMAGAASRHFVQLGDLIDRGPASVAALARARVGLAGTTSVTLMGNHEDRMLGALMGDPDEQAAWLSFGGVQTLASAWVDPADPDWPRRLVDAIGRDTLQWLARLPKLHRIGDIVFVHAGIDPDVPLDRQQEHTLIWTRWPWLDSIGPYPENVAVIHGHTPTLPLNISHPHRINLDTGAFRTGLLSGLVIVGDRMRVVQARARG